MSSHEVSAMYAEISMWCPGAHPWLSSCSLSTTERVFHSRTKHEFTLNLSVNESIILKWDKETIFTVEFPATFGCEGRRGRCFRNLELVTCI